MAEVDRRLLAPSEQTHYQPRVSDIVLPFKFENSCRMDSQVTTLSRYMLSKRYQTADLYSSILFPYHSYNIRIMIYRLTKVVRSNRDPNADLMRTKKREVSNVPSSRLAGRLEHTAHDIGANRRTSSEDC